MVAGLVDTVCHPAVVEVGAADPAGKAITCQDEGTLPSGFGACVQVNTAVFGKTFELLNVVGLVQVGGVVADVGADGILESVAEQ
jgi:hypothetical protein